jgi:hypothetical protein
LSDDQLLHRGGRGDAEENGNGFTAEDAETQRNAEENKKAALESLPRKLET